MQKACLTDEDAPCGAARAHRFLPDREGVAPTLPSLAGASVSHPPKSSFRSPAELAHVRHGGGLSAQTVLGVRLPWRTAPSVHKAGPRETPAILRAGKVKPLPLGRKDLFGANIAETLGTQQRKMSGAAHPCCAARCAGLRDMAKRNKGRFASCNKRLR